MIPLAITIKTDHELLYTVDIPAVKPFFDYMIDGGVHAVFILGSTGEGPALSCAEQKKFILESVKVIASRVPLLVGISGASGAESSWENLPSKREQMPWLPLLHAIFRRRTKMRFLIITRSCPKSSAENFLFTICRH
ncbi:MAG: hypothetical protein E7045_05585 [Lentisphaerae bacterium]|nr:hypothetical protein [Lentisphaerota bacterium]